MAGGSSRFQAGFHHDRRLRKLFDGERGLPFKKTEEL
jgi:hypothetical protein